MPRFLLRFALINKSSAECSPVEIEAEHLLAAKLEGQAIERDGRHPMGRAAFFRGIVEELDRGKCDLEGCTLKIGHIGEHRIGLDAYISGQRK